MITVHASESRGHADHGWLDTYHTFSFNTYHNRDMMRFRSLRVMNEDRVAPGMGFGEHPHHDMEIVTYVLSGELEHRDSMGNGEVLRAGEFQRMSAGTGITHSEFNPSQTDPVHLYQIWLLPVEKGIEPSYQQKRFDDAQLKDRLHLVASPDAKDGALAIHQDAKIYLAKLGIGVVLRHQLDRDRHAWLQLMRGTVAIGKHEMSAGDGAAISDETELVVRASSDAELLLFDLA
jgi:redox-sensitive bicupin YhaK (pirin superfamily)